MFDTFVELRQPVTVDENQVVESGEGLMTHRNRGVCVVDTTGRCLDVKKLLRWLCGPDPNDVNVHIGHVLSTVWVLRRHPIEHRAVLGLG